VEDRRAQLITYARIIGQEEVHLGEDYQSSMVEEEEVVWGEQRQL